MKYLVASASLLVVCLANIDTHHARADDFIDDAIASEGRVHATVLPCKNMRFNGATFDFFYENRTNLNFKHFRVKITAFDRFGHIIDRTSMSADGLRPNIRRAGQLDFYDGTCTDIESVLVEDDWISLWESNYLEAKEQTPRLIQLLSLNWSGNEIVETTFASKQETGPSKKNDKHNIKLELKPLGIAADIFHDIGTCGSEYHVRGGMGTLAYDGPQIFLGLSNSEMTINDLSNLPFSRTGGTLVNFNGEYVEFFNGSYPELSRVLILENDDLASAKGEFVSFKDSNLLFTEGYAEFHKPECENMSDEESSRLHEHCYVGSEGITLLSIYKNGDLDSQAATTWCTKD